ncbi:MAG TPA: error-prone DNA polymerase [Limnobacter sp.]|uniref:error-prone DNA polymerase n=1 Tax=Limnobacter sp. TaxID=2003368 RepID=UPI002ED92619
MNTEQHLPGFAELLCTSNFSFLKGASHPEELVLQASRLGYRSLAITDECSLAGIVRAHEAAREHSIHLIVGAQFELDSSSEFAGQCFALLVKNREGYTQLCRLITRARTRADKGQYTITHRDLANPLPGLLLLLIPQDSNKAGFPAFLAWCSSRYTGRIGVVAHMPQQGFDTAWATQLRTLAGLYQCPVLASNRAVMHAPDRKPLHDVLTAIRCNGSLQAVRSELLPNCSRSLHTRAQLAQLYPADWLDNTLHWAAQCGFSMDELKYQYPREVCPEGLSPAEYLSTLVKQGAEQRFPEGIPDTVQKQMDHELQLIAELQYEAYFLTVHDIVRFARSQNILCQGRGSAANSVVCYCLYITEVNPADMAVLFERFISRERNEPPDIDVDFEHSRREEVIQYIYRKYGRHRAALAASVVVYRPRSAIRDAGKALGLAPELIEQIATSQDGGYNRVMNLEHAQQAGLNTQDPVVRRCLFFAEELLRFPRHLSQHTGGFVIARDSLDELVPVENAAMAERTVIQWDKDDLDAMGLMKVDVLALGMLSAIRLTLDELQHKPGAPHRLQDIPPEEPETYRMMSNADTIGVFQVESRAQMGMLPRLRPKEFYDLVIQVAIVRPGPIQGGMVHPYLKRRQNPAAVEYPSDALKTALERTLGVPIFQEQVMQIAILAAGFSPGEADQLRRGMAAWKRRGGLHHFYDRVVGGMLERGYTREFAESIFRQMEGFGEYGFPESHAASFAKLVYLSAWLKCNHPDAFLCGLLNAQPMGFYAPAQLIQDAQRHGVQVLPVDVQCSAVDSHLECPVTRDDHARTRLANNRLLYPVRLGFNRISGLKQAAAQRIVEARQAGRFQSVEDLSKRAQLDRRDLQALADADALKPLAGHRRQAVWQSTGLDHHKDLLQQTRQSETTVTLPPASALQDMLADYRSLGASLEHHPITFLRAHLAKHRIQPISTLKTYPDGRLARACGLVTHRQRPATAKGTVFLNLEDETGHVNVIVWNELAEQQRQILRNATVMGVFGIWQQQGEVVSLLAKKLVDYTPLLTELTVHSRDFR